jgi:hypothetical protein
VRREPFRTITFQVRAGERTRFVRRYLTLGVAYGMAELDLAPRGVGYSGGGGLLVSLRGHARLRLEAQLMLFPHEMPANLPVRVTAGIQFGPR